VLESIGKKYVDATEYLYHIVIKYIIGTTI